MINAMDQERGKAIVAFNQSLDDIDDAVLVIDYAGLERLGPAGANILRRQVERRGLIAEFDPEHGEWRIRRPAQRVLL